MSTSTTIPQSVRALITDSINKATGLSAVPANGHTSFDFDASKTGYTPLAIVGFTGSGNSGLVPYEWYVQSGTNMRVYYQNITSSPITPNRLTVVVLFQKN